MSGPDRTVAAARLALGAGGLVVVGAGVASLVGTPLAALVSIAIFLALGVLAHDAVIAPATVAGATAARRLLPPGYLAPLVVATALLGTLSVVALPVLVGINESPDNTTVVDRPYRATWLVLLALAVVAVVVVGAVRSARQRSAHDATGAAPTGATRRSGGAPVLDRAPRGDRTGRAAPLALASTAVVVASSAVRALRSRGAR